MKISWEEPKSSYMPRWKKTLKDALTSTSWLRVGFWLFIFLPGSIVLIQTFRPNPNFSWDKLLMIFMVLLIVTPVLCLVFSLKYFMDTSKVTVDDEGIKLHGPEDGMFNNYSYSKITSICLYCKEFENSTLSWEYKGKTISRGIPFDADLNKLQSIIEWNSKLKLVIKQS